MVYKLSSLSQNGYPLLAEVLTSVRIRDLDLDRKELFHFIQLEIYTKRRSKIVVPTKINPRNRKEIQ